MKILSGAEAYRPAAELLREYLAEVASRLDDFDGGGGDPDAEATDGSMIVCCTDDGTPLGCLAVRTIAPGIAELKRMYVRPAGRGAGLGGRLLAVAEDAARDLGCHTMRLDTAAPLAEALRLYRRHGYVEIPRYNDNPSATHWLQKVLPATGPT
jgi:GNAT superfamily N-acetyltransferase